MVAHGLATLPAVRSPEAVRRDRNLRRVGIGVLALFVLAGLVGVLGVRTATTTASGEGVELELQYGAVTRAGLATPYHLEVVRDGGFDGPVVVALTREFFDRFDYQNFYPNPDKETADEDWVVYEFAPPEGEVFRWSFDVKASPNQLWSARTYRTQLREPSGAVVAELDHRMVVVP